MSLEALGNIGDFIGGLAVVITLLYLALQIRQNTRALRASTFQEISSSMSLTSEAVATHPHLSELIIKAEDGLRNLSPEERVRYNLTLMMSFRRFESVFVQGHLGSIEPGLTEGFEQSMIGVIAGGAGQEWWETAKLAFSADFVAHVDEKLASGTTPRLHAGFGGPQ